MSIKWKGNHWLSLDRLYETAEDLDQERYELRTDLFQCHICDADATFYVQPEDADAAQMDALMLCDEHTLIWAATRTKTLKNYP